MRRHHYRGTPHSSRLTTRLQKSGRRKGAQRDEIRFAVRSGNGVLSGGLRGNDIDQERIYSGGRSGMDASLRIQHGFIWHAQTGCQPLEDRLLRRIRHRVEPSRWVRLAICGHRRSGADVAAAVHRMHQAQTKGESKASYGALTYGLTSSAASAIVSFPAHRAHDTKRTVPTPQSLLRSLSGGEGCERATSESGADCTLVQLCRPLGAPTGSAGALFR